MTTTPSHIVVLSLENENYSDIVGSAQAPYLNSLISQGMLLTNFYGVTHPSQPNYIALFSGSTQGVTTNGPVTQLPASVPTLASTLAAHGYTFGGYAETTADPERQPWMDFANSANDGHDFSTFPQTAAGFANLPTVSFVSPNDAHNMTPTSDNGGGIPAGDAWVQANLSSYVAWAQANNSLLIVTFDENNTNPAVTYPDHIAGIVVGAGVPAGVVNDSPADQYSLLATIESLYGATAIGASAGVPALNFYSATPPTSSTSVDLSFSGLSDLTNTPPQNALAVGSNYILTAETTHYEITDLSGHPIVSNGSLSTLFSPLGATLDNRLLDARAAYDSSTGHYVIIAENFQPGTGNFATNIDIAVSVDSNPNDGWYLASIDTSNGNTTQADMPYLSVSNGKIYISTPEYLDAGGGYNNGEFVINESSVIAAGNAAIAPDASQSVSPTGGIVRNIAGDNGETYYLSTYSTGRETGLTYQTYDPTHGFSGTQTLFLGDADVGGGGNNFTAAQLGTAKTLDINDGRLQSLAYTSSGGHNYVFGVSEVMPSAGAPAEIEWFKLDVTDPTNPQFVIGNVISGASIGTGVAVFNPSIAVDHNGDVLINFSASGSNMYPADYYTVLGAGASAFTAPTLYQASTTFFDSGALNDQRWGTYSTAIADPNNPGGFWISNEYIANGWWQTAVAQVSVHPDTTPPVAPTGLSLDATTDSATIGDRITNFSHVKIDGTAELGSTVTLYDSNGTTVLGTGTASLTTGAFSITTSALADGTHNITAKATDAWGNASTASAVLAVTEDSTAPVAPTGLSLDATTDSGTIGDGITSFGHVKIDGTAEHGSTVTLYDTNGTTVLGTGTADLTTGAFSITTTALADGTHNITAKATDAAGNTGAASAVLAVTEDSAAPVAPTGLSLDATTDSGIKGDGITSFTHVLIDGTAEHGSTVTLYDSNGTTVLGTGTADPTTGAFSIATSTLAEGTHSITAKATDAAGNTSIASNALAVTTFGLTANFDFSGDGHSDILWRDDNGAVSIWSNGDINQAHIVAQAGVVPNSWHIAGTGDFDGNGESDILWRNDTGAVSIWDNGDISKAHIVAAAGVVPNSWHIAGTGDFDGNGKSDILWRNDNGAVSIWDNGDISKAHIVAAAGVVPNNWQFAGTGDFDGNGKTDILWRNDNGAVSIWDNGDISKAHIVAAAGVVPNSWHFAGTGDFDGNGQSDILWRNDNGAVSIWDNGDISKAHIVAAAGVVPNSWHIAGTGDYDGNGHSDILWRNDNGAVSIWDNGQLGAAHIVANGTLVPNDWHIA
ncbi:Ig-like domain-containing protein [Bradyrhizobium sp. CIAT3101]|uniref:Ig-like domain-containing protein n=1 Tax=Bradyrhizobium sp. CIAT3101 TaxID=439387 RepID=UPI0024B184FD|nr:Ig-like domain-containing protein [Bradyrhizobium sp. CIAT3101]WFU83811.1 Ig-like domain-containing protein [Bradyrhizobium sp. CIAT3101]